MIYSVVPVEQIMSSTEDVSPAEIEEMTIDGRVMQVQAINAKQAQIVRLISTDPLDYLNPAYAPGQIVQMQPKL